MNFNQELQKQRKRQRLNIDEAAERLHLSAMEYQDREDDRVDMNVPERCGLLVGLGMNFDEAIQLATQWDCYSPSDFSRAYANAARDLFVRETEAAFFLSIRTHDGREYVIDKNRVRSTKDVLHWIRHLSEMSWVTSEHICLFTQLASRYLDLEIYGCKRAHDALAC